MSCTDFLPPHSRDASDPAFLPPHSTRATSCTDFLPPHSRDASDPAFLPPHSTRAMSCTDFLPPHSRDASDPASAFLPPHSTRATSSMAFSPLPCASHGGERTAGCAVVVVCSNTKPPALVAGKPTTAQMHTDTTNSSARRLFTAHSNIPM